MTPLQRQSARILRLADAAGKWPAVLDVDPDTFKALLSEMTVLCRSRIEEVQHRQLEAQGYLQMAVPDGSGGARWTTLYRLVEVS